MNELSLSAAASAPGAFDAVWVWGLSVIHAFQSAGTPALTVLARFFSLLGSPAAYALIIPFFLWCVDERRGFRIGLSVFLSAGINTACKVNLAVPRPFVRDPSVWMVDETGFSTPSAHAQNSAVLWPLVAGTGPRAGRITRRLVLCSAAVILPLLIGLSRVYLGVHYPTDVLAGWALGALISCMVLFVLPAVGAFIVSRETGPVAGLRASLKDWQEHSGRTLRTWKIALAAAASWLLNTASGNDSSMGGLVFGFALGGILLAESGETGAGGTARDGSTAFRAADGSPAKKGARLALGLGIAALIFFCLKRVLPGGGSSQYALARFVRYGITGCWASWGAPKLFVRLGLQ